MAPVTFNTWIVLQREHSDPGIRQLASKWATCRGRLTADSVEARAAGYGCPPGTGFHAFELHRRAVAALAPAPADTGPSSDGAA